VRVLYLEADDLADVSCAADAILPIWWDLVRAVFGEDTEPIHKSWVCCIWGNGHQVYPLVVGGLAYMNPLPKYRIPP
jgi:hypothetical protein